jgi:hypothetical protein
VPEEQQGIAVPVVTLQQFLLDEPILFGRRQPRQTPVRAWDIVRGD